MTVGASPELFRGLVLCNTRYRQVSDWDRLVKNAIIKKITRCTEEQFNKLLCRAFFGKQEQSLTDEEVSLLISDARDTGMQSFLQQINLSLEDATPNYQSILDRLPITVIQGIDDMVMPTSGWDESGLQESTTQYRLELVKCPGGHLSILKHPDLIASMINNIITHENSPQNPSATSRPR